MLIKYPNSNVDFAVTPSYFLGDFDVYDREETLGERLKKYNPNDMAQLVAVLEEYFFKGARATGLNSGHKAELIRVLGDALNNRDFDFGTLVAHERDPDDFFTLPDSWNIANPREFFSVIYDLAIKFWGHDLVNMEINSTSTNDLEK